MSRFFKTAIFSLAIAPLNCEPLKFDVNGEAGLLMNANTGAILFEKECHKRIYPASTTKIATTLYALKVKGNQLDQIIIAEQDSIGTATQEAKRKSGHKLPAYWLEPDGTHIGIKKGEALALRDLIAASLIASANDASNLIAQGISQTIPAFMAELNAYLKSLGCLNTHFLNPHGLHHPDHQSTAFDLAMMAKEGLKHPYFRELILQPRFIRPKTNLQASATYLHTNLLIRSGKHYYPKAIGIKTGYHAKAKSVLVAGATSGGRTLITVLTGYAERRQLFVDAVKLFELAFNQSKVRRTYLKKGEQSFEKMVKKGNRVLKTYLVNDLSLDYYPAEDPAADCHLTWRKLSLPIRKNQIVADIKLVMGDNQVIKQDVLLAKESVTFAWPYKWIRNLEVFRRNFPTLSTVLILFYALTLIILGCQWAKLRSSNFWGN